MYLSFCHAKLDINAQTIIIRALQYIGLFHQQDGKKLHRVLFIWLTIDLIFHFLFKFALFAKPI